MATKKNEIAKKPSAGHDGSQQMTIHEPRLPYHPGLGDEQFGCIDRSMWRLLCDSVYPGAQTVEGIALAIRYCRVRKLDIMKRPVHVVPVWNAKLNRSVELVWPGIAEYRTTAARTGQYAGCDATEFGPKIEGVFEGTIDKWKDRQKIGTETVKASITFHEWSRVTVYRLIGGVRCSFPGPMVYFEEIYSRFRSGCDVPNDRWQKSPNGMLEKCAEAAALRKAFPEEIGAEPTAEEMEGKIIDTETTSVLPPMTPEQAKAQAESHLAAAGADPDLGTDIKSKAEREPEASAVQPSENADWEAILDEIQPGITSADSNDALTEVLNENIGILETINEKAPRVIKDKLQAMVDAKAVSFGNKK